MGKILGIIVVSIFFAAFSAAWGMLPNIFFAGLLVLVFFDELFAVILYVLVGGFLLDLISPVWGISLAAYIISALVLRWIFLSIFTNRSLIALEILGGVGFLILECVRLSLSGLTVTLFNVGVAPAILRFDYLTGLGIGIITQAIILALAYGCARWFYRGNTYYTVSRNLSL